jgi:hypothetical protein
MRTIFYLIGSQPSYIQIETYLIAAAFLVLFYLVIFYPKREAGFYSWHPVKRAFAVAFFPMVMFYYFLTSAVTDPVDDVVD